MNGLIFLAVTLAVAVMQSCAHSHTTGKASLPVNCGENRFKVDKTTLLHKKCPLEDEINTQINMELRVFYEYLNLGNYFAHENYNLPHFSKYFLNNAKEELKHAQGLMEYQVLRGAHVKLNDISAPKKKSFSNSCDAVKHAYGLELEVTQQIEQIWRKANTYDDIHLADHLETNFVTEQYESLKKLQDMIGTLKRLGICGSDTSFAETCDKLGEFQFDKTVVKDLTSS